MKAIVENEGMRIIRDSDPNLGKYWHTEPFGKEPEVLCVQGPYINMAIIRRLLGNEGSLSISAWGDSHGDTRGPDHHNHSSGIRIDMEPADINLIRELKDDYKFVLRQGLKFREEKNGQIIALSLNAFFVNRAGSYFLKSFRDNVNLSIDDIKRICKTLCISDETGLNFLRKLLLFGLVGIRHD